LCAHIKITEVFQLKRTLRRTLSLLLTAVLFLSAFAGLFPAVVSALDLSQKYEVSWDYTLTDENGNAFKWYTGLSASDNPYGYAIAARERSMHDYTVKRLGLTGSKSDWEYGDDYLYAFCVEHGIPLPNETEYTGSNSPTHGNKWEAMSENQRKLIQLALTYGYPNRRVTTSKEANAAYSATQLIVWQISLGFRTSPTALNDKTYPMSGHTGNMTEQLCRNVYFKAMYDAILADMASHTTIPSFMRSIPSIAPVYELTKSGTQYTLSLIDSNNVLSNFYVQASGGVSASISGNTLTLSSASPITSEVTVQLIKRLPVTNMTTGFLIWSVPGRENENQDMVTGVDADPVPAYLNLRVSTGSLAIVKTSQNNGGQVSGFRFRVTKQDGTVVGTYTSDSSGVINIPGLVAGWYRVEETNLSEDFVQPTPNPVSVEVKPGQTASVNFLNIKKMGIITIQKINANPGMGDYSLKGAVFEIRDQGNTLVDTVIVPESGIGTSKVLPLGVYRVTEKSSPPTGGFVRNTQTYTVALTGSQGAAAIVYSPICVIPENPQVARINIEKYNANPDMGDYELTGTAFEIFYPGGSLADTVAVDKDGKGQSKDLPLGKGYTIKEKTASYGFVRNKNTFTVDLDYGGEDKTVIYETVRIPETPQTGRIKVCKYNSNPDMGDYDLGGATFEIRNTVTGDLVDTVIVDNTGYGISKELPLTQPGKYAYSLQERKAPWGFFINSNIYYPVLSYGGQEAEIVFTDVAVPQRPQTGIITVEKRDVYNNTTPSGDATLKGMVVEIYDSAKTKVLDTFYCGNDVKTSSIELKLGSYFYREKNPPIGYTHDPTFHPFEIEYQGQEISIVYIGKTLTNKPIEGQISLVKHTDLPNENVDPLDPQIEKPVKATFEIYLKRVGSYADSKERERDRITTDPETGYAISKKLPYGRYIVEEVSAGGDVKLVAPFEVFINSEGKVYPFILNDPTFTSLVKVIKVDAETGKQIPVAGIGVKIWDVANNRWVEQTLNYPAIQKLDTFYTAGDGTVVLASSLPSGEYLLHEQPGTSPYGYLLAKDPVPFTIHSTQADPTIIEVLLANKPAKGAITIEKTGELLTGVQTIDTEFGKQYIPIFSQAATSGQRFLIKAASDIVTGDGTVRAKKGDIVDTLTIVNGTATSKLLYLGDYVVLEDFAGEPFVKNPKEYPVSLVFEDENTPVVTSTVKVENKRQAVELSLTKLMERPVDAPDGFDPFADVTFGIFAAESVKDNTGKVVIPKDGLIALMSPGANGSDGTGGKATLAALLPFCKVYAKELKTNIFYDINGTLYPVELKWQGEDVQVAKFSVTGSGIAIPNELKKGRIVVEKTGEILAGATRVTGKSDVTYTPIYELRGLPDVTFRLYADEDVYNVYGRLIYKKGDLVDTLKTGQDGKAESKLIHLGRYRLVEDVPFGYVGESEYPVTLGFDGELVTASDGSGIITKTVSIHNERQKASVILDKIMELPEGTPTDRETVGEDFNPYADVLFALYAREDIKNADGEIAIPAGACIEIFGVDAKTGKAVINADLPVGYSFFIKEIMTGRGYGIIDDEFDVNFDYASEKGAVVKIAVNNGELIENKLQRGSLKVIKVFEGREYSLPDVPFTFIGETAAGTTVTIEAKTDADGIIQLEGLLVGNWRVIELESDLTIGYVLSPEENAVVAANQIAELTINNKLQRGDLRIIKEFENQTHPISGVKFTVSGKTLTGEDYYGEFETDADGCIFIEGLVAGNYEVLEIGSELTTGYVLSEAQAAVIAHDEITEMSIHNRLIRGNVRLVKVDSSTGEPLQGAEFTLYDPDGNFAGVYTTDKNGVILVEGLPYGIGYKWVETKVPAGFKLPEGQIPFDITEDGVTVELNAENDRIPETPDIPKTGDNSSTALWLILMVVSAAAFVGFGIAGKRKKEVGGQAK
jgi:uncharacterized surface anchored protein